MCIDLPLVLPYLVICGACDTGPTDGISCLLLVLFSLFSFFLLLFFFSFSFPISFYLSFHLLLFAYIAGPNYELGEGSDGCGYQLHLI